MAVSVDKHLALIPNIINDMKNGCSKKYVCVKYSLSVSELNALLRSRYDGLEPFTVGEHIERVLGRA